MRGHVRPGLDASGSCTVVGLCPCPWASGNPASPTSRCLHSQPCNDAVLSMACKLPAAKPRLQPSPTVQNRSQPPRDPYQGHWSQTKLLGITGRCAAEAWRLCAWVKGLCAGAGNSSLHCAKARADFSIVHATCLRSSTCLPPRNRPHNGTPRTCSTSPKSRSSTQPFQPAPHTHKGNTARCSYTTRSSKLSALSSPSQHNPGKGRAAPLAPFLAGSVTLRLCRYPSQHNPALGCPPHGMTTLLPAPRRRRRRRRRRFGRRPGGVPLPHHPALRQRHHPRLRPLLPAALGACVQDAVQAGAHADWRSRSCRRPMHAHAHSLCPQSSSSSV